MRYDFSTKSTINRISFHERLRPGSMLILCLVLIAFFSVVVYTFAVTARLDLAQTDARENVLQQRLVVDSVLELVQASRIQKSSTTLFDAPITIPSMAEGSFRGGVILPSRSNEATAFGLFNESAKLNLNYLASRTISREQAIEKISKTPGIESSVAASIVDYLRSTNTNSVTVSARPLQLEDLLTVSGVTAERLYGHDLNRDGLLEKHEQRKSQSFGLSNDDSLGSGWSQYWTTIAGESTFARDGSKKIRLNQPNLALLYDELTQHFTPEEARFVIAWRLAPAKYSEDRSQEEVDDQLLQASEERKQTFEDRIRQQMIDRSAEDMANVNSGMERDGIRLDSALPMRIPSLVSLCQCTVQIAIRGEDQVLKSPFPNSAQDLGAWLARWEEHTTLSNDPIDVSRIHIHQASVEMLMTIQGMTESLAHSIVNTRKSVPHSAETESVAWLLSQGLVTWKELRMLSAEMTIGGDVLSGIGIGEISQAQSASRVYFILDRSFGKSRWLHKRDLDPIPGFLAR